MRLKSLRTCEWALREGVIINQLREMMRSRARPCRMLLIPGCAASLLSDDAFGYEEAHATR